MATITFFRTFAVEMKIKEVVEALERFAPLPLQEDYDNAGLQIGLTESKCSGALLCLDVTEDVIDTAIAEGCNLIVAHHPLLFRGLKRIGDEGYVERCVRRAILGGLTIYAAHTNLDNAPDGVCFEMAKRLGLQDVRFLDPIPNGNGGSGVIGKLAVSTKPIDLLKQAKEVFQVENLMHNAGPEHDVQTVALCGGAGEFLIDTAYHHGADVFLTGEIGYHRFFGYEKKLWIGALGHFQSERYTIQLMHRILAEAHPDLVIKDYAPTTNPINYL